MDNYSITIQELIKRPDIRNDFSDNDVWMNKMTDKEIDQFYEEAKQLCIKEGVTENYPDMNVAVLAKHIDMGILYRLFMLGNYE